MTWQCPQCFVENPESQPVCQFCDAQRVVSGGGVVVLPMPKLEPIDAIEPLPE